ncbi:hypothetical protein HYPSUDRAFT_53980 [Hypholoma sublateritium FD-334 SS-4]|uniref:Phytocyanin domain-containing protein n=1 Tax=Hypholoma sublateritium (strain FD-334 SS-4) TaxID=945553 RepID=A0A0D2LA49_HYPSF|nr:hypothetical protein HYPSUDRAFT_53980 [Hypholoma sublateritium FD-334 SS-4]
MHFISTIAVAAATFTTAVSAANFSVIVGQNAANVYEPNQLTGVQSGDFVSFQFVSKNHTVTQSTFAAPCVAKAGGVNSGYVPANATLGNTPEWTIQIDNASAPLWFFCEQGTHCELGMVFAINPTADKSFAAFLATAQGTNTTTAASTASTAATTATTAGASTTTASAARGLSAQSAGSLLAVFGAVLALAL